MAFCIFVLQSSKLVSSRAQTSVRTYQLSSKNTVRVFTGKVLVGRTCRRLSKWLFASAESESTVNQCVSEEKIVKEVTEVISGVDINVRLTSLGGRRRRISGGLDIEAPVKRVWEVMTDYEKLPEILPNIVESRIISDTGGDKQVEQVILLSRTFNIRSRIVVQVIEDYLKALRFLKMQSRDFEEFDGTYRFSEIESVSLVERKILKEVPKLLSNIREVAIYGKKKEEEEDSFS